MIKEISKNQTGSALFLAMMILSAVLIISLGASGLIISGQKAGTTQFFSTKAYFAAEAGVERALWELRINGASPCSDGQYFDFSTVPASCAGTQAFTPFFKDLGQSYYTFFVDDAANYIFKSVGDFSDTKRSLEISYPK